MSYFWKHSSLPKILCIVVYTVLSLDNEKKHIFVILVAPRLVFLDQADITSGKSSWENALNGDGISALCLHKHVVNYHNT